MKRKLTTLKINLQEGLIMANTLIVGCYSHHNKVVAYTDYLPDYELPADLQSYQIIKTGTDSISLTVWTNDGYKDLNYYKLMHS